MQSGIVQIPIDEYTRLTKIEEQYHSLMKDDRNVIWADGYFGMSNNRLIIRDEAIKQATKIISAQLEDSEQKIEHLKNKDIPFSFKKRKVKDL